MGKITKSPSGPNDQLKANIGEGKIKNLKKRKQQNLNYFADRRILNRVEDYLSLNKNKAFYDINQIVDDLMKIHKEYSRRKRAPFKAIVEKAVACIQMKKFQNGEGSSGESEDLVDYDEEGENHEEEEEDDPDELSALDEEELDEEELEEDDMEKSEDDMENSEDDGKHSNFGMKHMGTSTSACNSQNKNKTEDFINISSDESDEYKNDGGNLNNHTTSNQQLNHISGNDLDSKQTNNNKKKINSLEVLKERRKQYASHINKLQLKGGPIKLSPLQFPIKTKTCVKFQNVGGCSKIIKEISKFILHLRHPVVFSYLGIIPPRGFLLHGPPGTGKTLLARAIAGEMNMPLIQVSAPELIKGISGSSEERIRLLFDQAVQIAPCIVFLDEIDSITPNRETAQREMERRIVAQLISSLDEMSTTHNGNKVLVIGATNHPDSIDPALRRAGRFDREISLGIPDRQARKEILAILTSKLRMSPNVSIDKLAAFTPGFVGADLKALITEAAMAAVSRMFSDDNINENTKEEEITEENLPTIEVIKETPDVNKENGVAVDSPCLEGEPAFKMRKLDSEPISSTSMDTEISVPQDISVSEGDKNENEKQDEQITEPKEMEESTCNNEAALSTDKMEDDDVITVDCEDKEEDMLSLSKLLESRRQLTFNDLRLLMVEECDFLSALKCVQPSAKREGFVTVPDVSWDDIGSLKNIHDELHMTIMAPVRYPAAFDSLGLRTSSGVLLCGPPGCGKTLVAKAVANEADINFISVKGPELLNMYVGESERAVRQCFFRARNSQPCVIFFDELDALCPKRSVVSEGGASMRVVNQLLTEMDGVEGRHGVFVMAASNRPDMIDPAILRPGRLDKILYIGMPSSEDRVDILKALTKNGKKPLLDEDVNLEELGSSDNCSGFTGADLSSLVHEASVIALMEYMKMNSTDTIKVASKHFQEAFKKIRPSVLPEDLERYERLRKKYQTDTNA